MQQKKKTKHQAMTLKELANRYHVKVSTIRAWLKPHLLTIGQRDGHTFKPTQVRIIEEILGPPDGEDQPDG